MHESISLTVERLPEAQEKECRIVSPLQIQSLLRGIVDSGSRVALYFDGVKDFIMSSLLAVGNKGMWVEQGMDLPKNRRIAESKRLALVSSLNGVKIQFTAAGVREVEHKGYAAFYLPFPDHLYRIQRREYFRLAIPSSEPLRCSVPLIQPRVGEQMVLPVLDISGGGVRLSCTEENIEFVLGQIYAACQIDLPEVGKIEFTMVVKSVVSVSPKPGQTIQRIGCEFKNLDNASGVLLQRYVTRMQRLKNELQ